MLRTDCFGEQDLPRTFLAHDELASVIIVIIIIIINIIYQIMLADSAKKPTTVATSAVSINHHQGCRLASGKPNADECDEYIH